MDVSKRVLNDIKRVIKQGNRTRIVVVDQSSRVVINLPLTIAGVVALIAPFLIVVFAGIGVVLKYKVSFK